jgi:uncharacterized protein YecE (DUF72 family)
VVVGRIAVGTASWTDKTLLASGWYPLDAARDPVARLRYYAERFDVVEVDSTYYTPPNEANSARWVERTPDGFRFVVKAFSLLTQHPTRVSAIYKDLRPDVDKRTVYAKDLEPAVVAEVWERFAAALAPLDDAGKLGAVAFQFPQWFTLRRTNKDYLLECKERIAPYRMSVEFRSATWFRDEAATEETLDFLRSYGLPMVCVDMPQGHASSVPPVVVATAGDYAAVRFHGHSQKWTSRDIYERFGYHYSDAELAEWAPRVAGLGDQAAETHVLFNNCYRDYAQTNARQLADLLAGG